MLRDTAPQVSFDSAPSGVQVGLLRVHPTNPIYFTDDSGKAIYLGGHQIFVDLQDNTFGKTVIYNHQVTLDWNWYLGFEGPGHQLYPQLVGVQHGVCQLSLHCRQSHALQTHCGVRQCQ